MKKWIPDIKKLFGYYQEKILISKIQLIDINISNFWYQEFDFLIYKTSVIFLVIKNYIFDIKKWILDINRKIELLISRNNIYILQL